MTGSKYTYCIVDATDKDRETFGTGIDGEPVSVVVQDGTGAIVHNCPPEAYDTDDRSQAETWVKQHNSTIERAADAFGTPLPMTFDTIFEDEASLRTFLTEHQSQIRNRLDVLAGTEEYGIRIYCEEDVLLEETEPAPDSTGSRDSGMAYFDQKKREKQRQRERAERTKERFQTYFPRIESVVDEIIEEELERGGDDRGRNVLTASCLVANGEIDGLKRVLSEIDDEPGVDVVFTGPWHPYSFVGSLGTATENYGT
ncbi:gas vesicle protein GvpL [Natronococcus sp.]|uniref:gas vesicle protein GvpL n=1 Tax=Natronococcus sp. TaxID=35747 RepID=UPI003A4E1261